MNFKTLLLLVGIVGLGGCNKAPVAYVEAAERMATDVCEGIVTDKTNKMETYLELSGRGVVRTRSYSFTCITEKGSEIMQIPFKSIPVKYFKSVGGENND